MSIAIALGCEQKWTLRALERFLARMGQYVTAKRARPWEFTLTVWTGHSIWSQTVS